jgi:beta-lactamase class A
MTFDSWMEVVPERPTGVLCALALVVAACGTEPERTAGSGVVEALRDTLEAVIAGSGAEVGLYYRTLGPSPDSILVAADERMHAASTMKVPVMMRLFLDDQEGIRSLDDRLPVVRTFSSIVDGSSFDLPPESDSDTTFYGHVGGEAAIIDMIDRMITWSSNLATNLLIEVTEPTRINTMLRELGADSMNVLRGVEDLKAFRAGLSNTTTARDLGVVMRAVAESDRFTEESRRRMFEILARQHFRAGIPAGLPDGTRVANKTGWITGIQHDAALVMPERGAPYVLVVMVRGHPAEDQGEAMIAELSRLVWRRHSAAGS